MKTKLLSIFFCSIVVGASLEVSGEAVTYGNAGSFFVREADRVKIAQRFIAGVLVNRTIQSAKRTAEGSRTPRTINFSRPFHGLINKSRPEPSTEVLGYSHFVRFTDATHVSFAKVFQQNPSPAATTSPEAAQQKARERVAARRAEMAKRAAERQAKNAQRVAEKKARSAKGAEESKAKSAEQKLKRQASSAKRSAERKAKSENAKAAREATMAKRAANFQAREAKRAAAAEKRKGPADGTFRFLSSRMNAHSTKVVKGAPYSAHATTEFVQKFVDGNQIIRRNEAVYYRDSEGRTRVEQKLNTIGKWTASGDAPTIITIGDPVSGTFYSLDPRTRTAVKNSGLGKRLQQQYVRKTREAGQEKTISKPERSNSEAKDGRRRTEDLGKQRIEGVEAQGKRVTTIIPAGEIGNTMPIEITDESWYSDELQTLVMTKRHDPRSGDTTYRLTNISRREPDHLLFKEPPDYAIVDQFGQSSAPAKDKTEKDKTEKDKKPKSQLFD